MKLADLLDCSNADLSDEQLEQKIILLQKLKVTKAKGTSVKSNKEHRIEDLLDGLSAEELANLAKLIGGES